MAQRVTRKRKWGTSMPVVGIKSTRSFIKRSTTTLFSGKDKRRRVALNKIKNKIKTWMKFHILSLSSMELRPEVVVVRIRLKTS
jgi:hypothetical protein